ncbi:MAG TPA: cytochrome c biogenesis protein CcdA [Candidatus Saccharimonadales bacterium]|nr:cytochrome c biogenesis protein CcdA [Candidatus Saccharimonadales bacterium]
MELLVVSFVAGVLTVLAPCILPLLPVIVGGSALAGQKDWRRPVIITASLAVSVIIFTLLLKASTSLLMIPPYVWQLISGGIVLLFGLSLLFETAWAKVAVKFNLGSNKLLGKAAQQQGWLGAVLVGMALGPVFSSCSPTYALIVAGVLPASFGEGLTYLIAYAVGLSAVLLLVGLLGQQAVHKLGWASNPHGWFKRTLAIVFILVGLGVIFGIDKAIQTFVVQNGWYDPISTFENQFLNR